MKKILGLILVLVCFVTHAFAEPVSQEILDQARAQAGLFMDLKNALGLDWLDKYNIYLQDPENYDEPSWAYSVDELISENYLSSSFPTDFTIGTLGQEAIITRTITNQGIKNILPIYLPSITINGDTVSLLVQRPAQWVAWQAGLANKISRDGEGYPDNSPDILPNTTLEFGRGSEIKFIGNDGKLIGVNSMQYKNQELDDRFVNVTGDVMTGNLQVSRIDLGRTDRSIYGSSNTIYFVTSTGSFWIDSGTENKMTLGTNRESFSFNKDIVTSNKITANNIITGTRVVATESFRIGTPFSMSTFFSSSEARINGNTVWHAGNDGSGSGLNADLLDGKNSDYFVKKTGDTMTGPLVVSYSGDPSSRVTINNNGSIYATGDIITSLNSLIKGGQLGIYRSSVTIWGKSNSNEIYIGRKDLNDTIRINFYPEDPSRPTEVTLRGADNNLKKIYIWGGVQSTSFMSAMGPGYGFINKPDTYYGSGNAKISGNTVWHAGNDGHRSGLDADLLDGKHASEIIEPWNVMISGGGVVGSIVPNTWMTHVLSAVDYNDGTLTSLDSNMFTLPPGQYYIEWEANAVKTSTHQTRLYNCTNLSVAANGTSLYASYNYWGSNMSSGAARININNTTAFRIEHLVSEVDGGTSLNYVRVRVKKLN